MSFFFNENSLKSWGKKWKLVKKLGMYLKLSCPYKVIKIYPFSSSAPACVTRIVLSQDKKPKKKKKTKTTTERAANGLRISLIFQPLPSPSRSHPPVGDEEELSTVLIHPPFPTKPSPSTRSFSEPTQQRKPHFFSLN